MAESKIEWTERTWNPVTGCSKVSQGCKHCYAEVMHKRLTAMGVKKYSDPFSKVVCHYESLMNPLKVKTPSIFFVNSMSDLFHEDVPAEFIAYVFNTMAAFPLVCRKKDCEHDDPNCFMGESETNHTYQILTKRPERALKFFTEEIYEVTNRWPGSYPLCVALGDDWPLPNVWIGVSVEDQKAADERIPMLLQIPAAIRFISAEPLLGPIELNKYDKELGINWLTGLDENYPEEGINMKLDWVIAGGESGKNKNVRPMHPDWARGLRDQCKAAGVPFFFKQWGEFKPIPLPCASVFYVEA